MLRESRSPSQLRLANDVVAVERVLKKLPKGSKIALEAMGSWWWMVELAQKTGHEVFLSHPKQTKAIASARLKSDKVDALMLAKLLKADLLPTVWIPPENQRHIRELLTHRVRLVRQRTAVINELRAVYAKRNIDPQARLQRLHPVVTAANELGGYGPRIVDEDLKLLGFINGQVGGLDTELKNIAHEDGQAKRLMTIPGVGPVSAVAMSCWIGEIQRFSNAKKLASYLGLAPRVRPPECRSRTPWAHYQRGQSHGAHVGDPSRTGAYATRVKDRAASTIWGCSKEEASRLPEWRRPTNCWGRFFT